MLIAEVKKLVPARYGHKALIKQMPDQAFAVDAALYRRIERRFRAELTLWGASDRIRMVAIATFGVGETGSPGIAEITLMPVTRNWLPVENSSELELVERLVHEQRAFVKGLRYNLDADAVLANATLTDTGTSAVPLCIVAEHVGEGQVSAVLSGPTNPREGGPWRWAPGAGEMPPFPPVDLRPAQRRHA